MLFVDRATRCITAWRVVEQATETVVQAARYYSDCFRDYSSVTDFLRSGMTPCRTNRRRIRLKA